MLLVWARLSAQVSNRHCAGELSPGRPLGISHLLPLLFAPHTVAPVCISLLALFSCHSSAVVSVPDSNRLSTLSSERRSTVKQGLTSQYTGPNSRDLVHVIPGASPCCHSSRAYQNPCSNPVVLTLPSVLATTPTLTCTLYQGSGISESSGQHDRGLPPLIL
jgi:hypothetical protein